MKYLSAPVCLLILLIATNLCKAQPELQLSLKPPPARIKIDGDIKEWGDSLAYYSTAERLNYDIANSKDTLYIALKIYDNIEIAKVLNAGLTFSIDTKGKKKDEFSLTYPVNAGGTTSLYMHKQDDADGVTQEDRDQLMREKITTLRGIKVTGFSKDIEDDMITTSNTYGIRTNVDYDAVGNLILEEAIPLKFFHADLSSKNDWAFNIKINGIARQPKTEGDDSGGQGGGRHGGGGGMGGDRGGGSHRGTNGGYAGGPDGNTQSVDFWGKFALAK